MPTLAGKTITQNGLGLMRMTMAAFALPDEDLFKVLKAALDAGVNLWNSATYYEGNLDLMKRYFTKYPEDADRVVLTVKTGFSRATLAVDCSPDGLRKSCDEVIATLDGKKKVDLFGISRIDPKVPVEESVKALIELKEEGKCGGIQLSEVKVETIRRAASVGKIDMVEAEASLWSPEVFQNGVAEACGELGIVFVAHTPLGMGMLTGDIKTLDDLPADSQLRKLPRYQPDTFSKNRQLVDAVEKLAQSKGCSTPQLALSWLKAQSKKPGMPLVLPIAGARSPDRVRENAETIDLTHDDLQQIDSIMKNNPVEGYRTMPFLASLNEY